MSELKLRVGSGVQVLEVPISKAPESDLLRCVRESRNDLLVEAARNELERRAIEPEQPAEAADDVLALGGPVYDPKEASARLAKYAETSILISPDSVVHDLPDGCGVQFVQVKVKPSELYTVEDGHVLPKAIALKRLAREVRINWAHADSRRVDDGLVRFLAKYRSVGAVRRFDGSVATCVGEAEVDLRDGSPEVGRIKEMARYEEEEAKRRARAKGMPYRSTDAGNREVARHRRNIVATVRTKSQVAAIADFGIIRSYEPEEIQRPFIVARLVMTGQAPDPAVRERLNSQLVSALVGLPILYGPRPAEFTFSQERVA